MSGPNEQQSRLALVAGLAICSLALIGCPPQPPLPPETVNVQFDLGQDLGTAPQAVNYLWHYYAGNNVTSFRINLDATTLPPQAHVNLLDGQRQQVQRLTGAIGGLSNPIDGNQLLIQIWSQPFGPVPTLRINQMVHTLRRGPIFPEEPPLALQNYTSARRLSHNVATYGNMRGTDFADFFIVSQLQGKPIDIVVASLDSASLDVVTSYDEFLLSPDRAAHHVIGTQGNPAFIELDSAPRDKMFITVKSAGGSGRYYIMANHVRQKLAISYEFEGNSFWSRMAPSGQTFFELARALAVDASRQLYDSTDGMMRFDEVTIYKTARTFTIGDVYIHDVASYRENANASDIDIARQTLIAGDSLTVVHEWGHFAWGLPDEYEDVITPTGTLTSNPLCPNSIMGNRSMRDFCVHLNHDPTGALTFAAAMLLPAGPAAGDSMWDEISDYYDSDPPPGRIPRKTDTPGAERFGGLNLEPFMQWRIFN